MSSTPIVRLRLNELLTTAGNVLGICESVPMLAGPIAAIKPTYEEFNLGMAKASITSERSTYDDKRDQAFSGFKAQLRVDLSYPNYILA